MAKVAGQNYEYVLYGSVSSSNHQALLHRLRGLCSGATAGGVPFADREITHKIEAGGSSARVKVRQSLDEPEAPWHLVYHGQLELGDANRSCAVRAVVTAACSHTLADCLRELGFIPVSELILKGHVFRKGGIKAAVFTLHQPNDTGDPDSAQLFSNTHLVELSVLTASGQDRASEELKTFAEHLKPIVNMEKTDGVR